MKENIERQLDKLERENSRQTMSKFFIPSEKKFLYSITYSIITPSEDGEEIGEPENGYEIEKNIDELGSIISLATGYGINENSGRWWSSSDPVRDFSDGSETYYSLHIYKADGSDIDEKEKKFIDYLLSKDMGHFEIDDFFIEMNHMDEEDYVNFKRKIYNKHEIGINKNGDIMEQIRQQIRRVIAENFGSSNITSKEAAKIASYWHDGQSSLYSLASTGEFVPYLYHDYLHEISQCKSPNNSPEDAKELEVLEAWIKMKSLEYSPEELSPEAKEHEEDLGSINDNGPDELMINNILNGYLNTALWATSSAEGNLDDFYSVEDFSKEAKQKARADVEKFVSMAEADINKILSGFWDTAKMETIGHDLFLTRNGHGAGFWDGDYEEEIGKNLTNISKSMGSADAYIGDDNRIHF
jgi:hypothetical protein